MELTATERSVLGKASRAVRKEGKIPAEFYGHGMENKTLTVSKADFHKVFKDAGESTVITLLVDGKKQPALIYDVQHHPASGEVVHVDFYGVRMDQLLTASVQIEFVGEAPAVKEKGGVVNRAYSEIEVEALPADLPHSLTVDLSGLTELNQSITVKDIVVPKNVKLLLDEDAVIVTVTEPAPEEEIAPPVIDVADVKVETEEKVAQRAKEEEATPNA
jgi:large subunit ribosomal protein L25